MSTCVHRLLIFMHRYILEIYSMIYAITPDATCMYIRVAS